MELNVSSGRTAPTDHEIHPLISQRWSPLVTNAEDAESLAADIRAGENASGKIPEDYQIDFDDERGVYLVPPEKLEILQKDEVWRLHPLRLDRIDVVPVEALFETGAFAARTTALR